MFPPPLRTLAISLRPPDPRPVDQIDAEILDELEFHVAMRAMDNQRAGMSPEEATRDAERRFGDFERIHRSCRRVLLGERIMLQRVQTVLTAVLLAAVACMGVAFYRNQQANEEAARRMTEALQQLAAELSAEKQAAADRAGTLLASVPPVVVHSFPQTGSTDVDPAITEIRVTYSKPMVDRSWSWSQISDETFPATTGEPHYLEDAMTCVLPVSLEKGKEYVIWLNSENFHGFKDATGQSAVPYPLRFKTRD